LEKILEEDVKEAVSATRYERTRERKGYRNGNYLRTLLSRWGLIENLEVPRAREGGISFRLFDKYQRRQEDVDSAIGKLFIAGVSTRKLKNITKDLFGKSLSAITCGKTTEALEKEMKIYQNKEISDKVEFLFLDGMV